MRRFLVAFAVLVSLYVRYGESYPNRPGTCLASAFAVQAMGSQESNLKFSLNVSRSAFGMSDCITVTVVGDKPFAGLLMYIETDTSANTTGGTNTTDRIGSWNLPSGEANFQLLNDYCKDFPLDTTVGHKNDQLKDSGTFIRWCAPSQAPTTSKSGSPLLLKSVVALSRGEWKVLDPVELKMFPVR
jgi:hypothetical protein